MTALMALPYEGYFLYGSRCVDSIEARIRSSCCGPQDTRARVLYELGFTPPAELGEVAGDGYGGSISTERADLLDTDVLVWFAEPEDPTIVDDPLCRKLAVHTEGRDLFMGDADPLQIPITGFITVLKPRSCSTGWSPDSWRPSTATPPPEARYVGRPRPHPREEAPPMPPTEDCSSTSTSSSTKPSDTRALQTARRPGPTQESTIA